MGSTFGLEPGSFRAESYGMLSLMLFLDNYLRFFQLQVSANVEHLFYNQSLINRIACAMNRSWDNPNHCLSSEYDLESGIVNVIHSLPVNFSYHHVKGHQDEDTAVEDLPWEAQMSCHADTYATDCLDNWSEPSKLVPLYLPRRLSSLLLASPSLKTLLSAFAKPLAVQPYSNT